MNAYQLEARAAELRAEIVKANKANDEGRLENKRFVGIVNKANDELKTIENTLKNMRFGNDMAARQEAAMGGPAFSGDTSGAVTKSPSPMDLTDDQVAQLQWSFDNKVPCRIEIKSGAVGTRNWLSQVQTKSAVTESGLSSTFSGNLPPFMSPYAYGLPYETTDATQYLANMVMPGPSATWVTHTSNGAEVGGVAEGATKGDISPALSVSQVKPQKIAGVLSFSYELMADTETYGQANVAGWLPQELTRSLVNARSLAVWGASTAGSNPLGGSYPVSYAWNGLLNTSGTLTRAVGTDTPLDALSKAFADLRAGASFAEPDMVAAHPTTINALRRQKSANGEYLLDLIAGPSKLTAFGDPGSTPSTDINRYGLVQQGKSGYSGTLWGASLVATTQIPAGTAIVASIANGGGVFWTRSGLILEFDLGLSGSNFTNNLYSYRVEQRCAVSVPRATALNIVTGLPQS